MEVFQNLKLNVPFDREKEFSNYIIQEAKKNQWINRSDFEVSYKKNTSSYNDPVFCFESHDILFGNKTLRAFVWMWRKKEYYEVFNIIPSKAGSLTYSEYNYVLNVFFKEVLSDLIEKMGIKADFSNPNRTIIDLIGKDAGDSLLRFSKSANKSTGNTNPFDFERWCEFVFIIHRNNISINIDDFVRWLEEEENWSNEIAWKLGLDLEYALDILEKYEQD